jgi:hypothetical protein
MVLAKEDDEATTNKSSPREKCRSAKSMLDRHHVCMVLEGYETVFGISLSPHQINPIIKKLPRLQRELPHKKKPLVLGSILDDNKHHTTCDSYVTITKSGHPHTSSESASDLDFARVEYYFCVDVESAHNLSVNQLQWASVQIFIGGYETIGGFKKIDTTDTLQMIVPVQSISQPYITSTDADDGHLWYVNFRS